MSQLSLFEAPRTPTSTGGALRNAGMDRASQHAEQEVEGWGDMALEFLIDFIAIHAEFMVEDIRHYANGCGLPQPPTARAWGSVIVAAQRRGLVRKIGFRAVKNPKAHKTPATLWARA